jgi:hypothetical protein
MLQSIRQAFTLLPIMILALSNSDPTRATSFAAYIQIMRRGGAEIGVALMGTWLRVCEEVHSNFLGQHVETAASMSRACSSSFRCFFGPRRDNGPGKGPGNAIDAGLYRRLLAVLLAGDSRAFLRGLNRPGAGSLYAGTVSSSKGYVAAVRSVRAIASGTAWSRARWRMSQPADVLCPAQSGLRASGGLTLTHEALQIASG